MIDKITDRADVSRVVTGARVDEKKASSVGTDVALIALCLIAAFVSFWDVEITFASAFTIGWVSVFLYIVTTTVYRTKYDGGIYKGRETEAYKNALKNFLKRRDVVVYDSLTDDLREWCNAFRIKDLDNVRKDIVCPYMTYDEYLSTYSKKSNKSIDLCDLPKNTKKALKKANAIVPVELRADMLLNTSISHSLFGKRRALPISGGEKRAVDFLTNYVSKFVVTFLCGMFAIEILSNPSLEIFLQWVVRMFPVVMAFLTGETNGYRNAVEVDAVRLGAQEKMLSLFFADKEGAENEKAEGLQSPKDGVGSTD